MRFLFLYRQQLLGWRKQWQLPLAGKASAHPRVMLQSMRLCSTMPKSAQCECRRRPFMSPCSVVTLHVLLC